MIEVREGAEDGIDVAVISDVVAEIRHGRGINGRNPDRIDPEPGDVVEPLANALQVADAVSVRILKGTGIDLVEDAVLPPGCLGHGVSRLRSRPNSLAEFAERPIVPTLVQAAREHLYFMSSSSLRDEKSPAKDTDETCRQGGAIRSGPS
jgi:hypothetical protein